MSAEPLNHYEHADHKDSLLYMMFRREINEKFAETPVDFNVESLKAGEAFLGRSLTADDTIVDIGSSNGLMIAEAAAATDTQAHIICVEPDAEAAESHGLFADQYTQHISFVRAVGEAIPLRDNAAQGATLHNVIFRAQDAEAMLNEVKRVVEPGGFIAISTNGRGHAYFRHYFEALVAYKLVEQTGVEAAIPVPPAEGHYLEDLPGLVRRIGGLTLIDELYVPQNTHAIITPGHRLGEYLDSIKYSAANTDLKPQHRALWRKIVDTVVAPRIIDLMVETDGQNGQSYVGAPYFADPIRRGMFVLRNE